MSGLEALGIAASIIQVADLGTKLSVKLFCFFRQVKNADESIQLLSNEVALVSAILHELGANPQNKDSSKLCSDEAFKALGCVLKQCRDVLGQIQQVTDDFDQPKKNRLQQVTEKLRLVLLEPTLDPLKLNLGTLKSTMLLLLNVIMYAGQIRSNQIPTLLEEQRDLIQTLIKDREDDRNKLHGSNVIQSTSFAQNVTAQVADTSSDGDSNKFKPREQPSDSLFNSGSNLDESRSKNRTSTGDNMPVEVKEYNNLIQSILHEIESRRRTLEEKRHLRIKNGVLNIHSGEIMRFQMEHGPSIQIDHSLFIDHKGEKDSPTEVCSSAAASPTQKSTYQSPPVKETLTQEIRDALDSMGSWTNGDNFDLIEPSQLPEYKVAPQLRSPGPLEDLLAQWTTLDEHEIHSTLLV